MKKFIVTTTINPITKALEKFDLFNDWNLIVIGDKKTPDIKLKNGEFISHKHQDTLGFKIVSHIPWNSIQRRNIGYLIALKRGADIIASIDDDNIPFDNWGQDISVGKDVTEKCISDTLICDSLYEHKDCTRQKIWHRGFPVQNLEERYLRKEFIKTGNVAIEAGLWNGDPDVDAICRIAGGPFNLKFSNLRFLIDNTCFSPFNTQNTFFSKEAAICMCLPYDIGRMDDIWASYMTQRIMREINKFVLFTGPTVFQDRNIHDLTKDLQNEMIGYRNTLHFINRLNKINVNGKSIIEMYNSIINGIIDLPFISNDMIKFQKAWISDIEKIY